MIEMEEKRSGLILAGLIFLGGLALVTGLILVNYGITEPQLLQLSSNIFLTVLTGAYAFFTYSLLRENVRQRHQDIQPAFALSTTGSGVEVTNVGNGPAINTEITLTLSESGGEEKSVTISDQDIPTGESVYFTTGPFLNFGNRVFDGENFGDEIQIDGSYLDLHMNHQELSTRTYDLDEYRHKTTQGVHGGKETTLKDVTSELSNIQSEVSQLNHAMGNLGKRL